MDRWNVGVFRELLPALRRLSVSALEQDDVDLSGEIGGWIFELFDCPKPSATSRDKLVVNATVKVQNYELRVTEQARQCILSISDLFEIDELVAANFYVQGIDDSKRFDRSSYLTSQLLYYSRCHYIVEIIREILHLSSNNMLPTHTSQKFKNLLISKLNLLNLVKILIKMESVYNDSVMRRSNAALSGMDQDIEFIESLKISEESSYQLHQAILCLIIAALSSFPSQFLSFELVEQIYVVASRILPDSIFIHQFVPLISAVTKALITSCTENNASLLKTSKQKLEELIKPLYFHEKEDTNPSFQSPWLGHFGAVSLASALSFLYNEEYGPESTEMINSKTIQPSFQTFLNGRTLQFLIIHSLPLFPNSKILQYGWYSFFINTITKYNPAIIKTHNSLLVKKVSTSFEFEQLYFISIAEFISRLVEHMPNLLILMVQFGEDIEYSNKRLGSTSQQPVEPMIESLQYLLCMAFNQMPSLSIEMYSNDKISQESSDVTSILRNFIEWSVCANYPSFIASTYVLMATSISDIYSSDACYSIIQDSTDTKVSIEFIFQAIKHYASYFKSAKLQSNNRKESEIRELDDESDLALQSHLLLLGQILKYNQNLCTTYFYALLENILTLFSGFISSGLQTALLDLLSCISCSLPHNLKYRLWQILDDWLSFSIFSETGTSSSFSVSIESSNQSNRIQQQQPNTGGSATTKTIVREKHLKETLIVLASRSASTKLKLVTLLTEMFKVAYDSNVHNLTFPPNLGHAYRTTTGVKAYIDFLLENLMFASKCDMNSQAQIGTTSSTSHIQYQESQLLIQAILNCFMVILQSYDPTFIISQAQQQPQTCPSKHIEYFQHHPACHLLYKLFEKEYLLLVFHFLEKYSHQVNDSLEKSAEYYQNVEILQLVLSLIYQMVLNYPIQTQVLDLLYYKSSFIVDDWQSRPLRSPANHIFLHAESLVQLFLLLGSETNEIISLSLDIILLLQTINLQLGGDSSLVILEENFGENYRKRMLDVLRNVEESKQIQLGFYNTLERLLRDHEDQESFNLLRNIYTMILNDLGIGSVTPAVKFNGAARIASESRSFGLSISSRAWDTALDSLSGCDDKQLTCTHFLLGFSIRNDDQLYYGNEESGEISSGVSVLHLLYTACIDLFSLMNELKYNLDPKVFAMCRWTLAVFKHLLKSQASSSLTMHFLENASNLEFVQKLLESYQRFEPLDMPSLEYCAQFLLFRSDVCDILAIILHDLASNKKISLLKSQLQLGLPCKGTETVAMHSFYGFMDILEVCLPFELEASASVNFSGDLLLQTRTSELDGFCRLLDLEKIKSILYLWQDEDPAAAAIEGNSYSETIEYLEQLNLNTLLKKSTSLALESLQMLFFVVIEDCLTLLNANDLEIVISRISACTSLSFSLNGNIRTGAGTGNGANGGLWGQSYSNNGGSGQNDDNPSCDPYKLVSLSIMSCVFEKIQDSWPPSLQPQMMSSSSFQYKLSPEIIDEQQETWRDYLVYMLSLYGSQLSMELKTQIYISLLFILKPKPDLSNDDRLGWNSLIGSKFMSTVFQDLLYSIDSVRLLASSCCLEILRMNETFAFKMLQAMHDSNIAHEIVSTIKSQIMAKSALSSAAPTLSSSNSHNDNFEINLANDHQLTQQKELLQIHSEILLKQCQTVIGVQDILKTGIFQFYVRVCGAKRGEFFSSRLCCIFAKYVVRLAILIVISKTKDMSLEYLKPEEILRVTNDGVDELLGGSLMMRLRQQQQQQTQNQQPLPQQNQKQISSLVQQQFPLLNLIKEDLDTLRLLLYKFGS